MIKYNSNDVLLKGSTAGWGAVFVTFITRHQFTKQWHPTV